MESCWYTSSCARGHKRAEHCVDVIASLWDRLVDFTGPYVAVALLAVVIIFFIYRLLGRI